MNGIFDSHYKNTIYYRGVLKIHFIQNFRKDIKNPLRYLAKMTLKCSTNPHNSQFEMQQFLEFAYRMQLCRHIT